MESLEKELTLKIDKLDLKMKDELNEIKDKYNILKKDLRKEYSKKMKDLMPQKESVPRKSIPKIIRNQVWDTYIGKDKGVGKCYCCSIEIDSKHFECGHIKSFATGGTDIVDNLRPICSLCNKSIGSQNMDEFKQKYLTTQKEEPKYYHPMGFKNNFHDMLGSNNVPNMLGFGAYGDIHYNRKSY